MLSYLKTKQSCVKMIQIVKKGKLYISLFNISFWIFLFLMARNFWMIILKRGVFLVYSNSKIKFSFLDNAFLQALALDDSLGKD